MNLPPQTVLITGGSGFFGGILKRHLLEKGYTCINIDLLPDEDSHPRLRSLQLDLRDYNGMFGALKNEPIGCIFHCAAMLAHDIKDQKALWDSNVEGTRNVGELALNINAKKIVFISSNCLWGKAFGRPVKEEDEPDPIEVYGKSKWEAEKVLGKIADRMPIAIIRSPTIVDAGRLGLLSILFEFIVESRRVWVVGSGANRYQFIYAKDFANACHLLMLNEAAGVFNIGSDNVKSLREIYQYVIDKAGSQSRVVSFPRGPAILAMRLAHLLNISPLGPYHYRMIAEDFIFDTSKLKAATSWSPTLTNEEMLFEAYQYYSSNKHEITARETPSAHRKNAPLGVIRILKWLS